MCTLRSFRVSILRRPSCSRLRLTCVALSRFLRDPWKTRRPPLPHNPWTDDPGAFVVRQNGVVQPPKSRNRRSTGGATLQKPLLERYLY